MKCCRAVLVSFVVVVCVFLTGFKKPGHIQGHSNKKHQTVKVGKSPQKPLDLSVPQRDVSFEEPEIIAVSGNTLPVAFAPDSQNKARPIELQGKVIMSQEPEAGKMKSADGAGIVINLNH